MSGLVIGELAALVGLIILSAGFSSAETALFYLSPLHIHRIARHHPKEAKRIEQLLATPASLLSTILIGNTVVNVTASAIGFSIAEHLFPGRGELVAIPVMTLVLLIFGEVTPKRHAVSRAEKLAALYSGILLALIRLMTPIRALVERLVALFRAKLHAPSRALTEDEFLSVVEYSEEKGVLNAEERTMVDGIVRLEEMQASEVMTPRVDLIGIDLRDPPESRIKTALRVQFRYLPVYQGSPDHPEGFLDVPRFLLSESHDFEAARIEPLFVPETAPLSSVLAMFQQEHRRVAFVSDEYGGTAGLITLGDILEEIVGDVEGELGIERLTIQKMGENLWIVDGRTSLEEINYELDTRLDSEGADRISGWIAEQVGRMPHTGEAIEAQGCRVTVHRTRKNTIVTVFIEHLPPSPPPTGEEP